MSLKLTRRALGRLTLCVGLVASASAPAANPQPVTVFAAASLKTVLEAVDGAYTARTQTPVRAVYAASSALARQIEQGAPADVFISADTNWMDYVAGKGLIVASSRKDLLTNHLALIAPADSTVKLTVARGMPLSQALGAGRLAVAGPEVPAGIYAKASLTALGVWPQVADKLAPADNVRGALQFVARGEAPLGIVYDTDALAEPKVRIVGLFPDSTHPPIIYPGAVLAHAASPDAGAFLAFLSSAEASAIFRQYGFQALSKSRP